MAKSQRRSTREIRKPKAVVSATPAEKQTGDRPKSQVELLMQKPKVRL